jgi:hypothetical protein
MNGYIIMDTSVKRMNARTPLEEGLFFAGFLDQNKEDWRKAFTESKVYPSAEAAVAVARQLKATLPSHSPKVFFIQQNGPNYNIGDINYQ